MEQSTATTEQNGSLGPKIHIPIHSLVEAAQSHHGLRHGDYNQYRAYCTRRLSRLRHSKIVRNEVAKITTSEKGSNKGGRHAFKPTPYYRDTDLALEIAKKHENFMLIELMSAERAWSYAMKLKSDYDDIKSGAIISKKEGSRKHFMQRFIKAVKFSDRLEEMAIESCDENTVIEAKAYAAWMRGNLSLEKADYKRACVQYGIALTICRNKGNSFVADTDAAQLEMRDYFTARAENVIEPLLRFCQYELTERGMSESDIVELMKDVITDYPQAEEDSSTSATSSSSAKFSIQFRDQTVPISNNALRVAMLKLNTLVATYRKNVSKKSKKLDSAFVDLLSSYDDAVSIISKEQKEIKSMKSGPAVDAKKRELEGITGYLKFHKQKLLMERNERMVNELKSSRKEDSKLDEEVAHLYEVLLQDARTVASLPGGLSGETESTEDDFLLEANAHILRYRALRCYYLGRLYSNKLKYKEAVTLFDHAHSLAAEAAEELNACMNEDEPNVMDALVKGMTQLDREITGAKCRAQAHAYLTKTGKAHLSSHSQSSCRSLLERLDDFDGGSALEGPEKYRLADVPPTFKYIPCKPTFFDIAGNYVGELPDEELKQAVQKHCSASKSSRFLGWFGMG